MSLILDGLILTPGSGGGGTSDYNDLTHKPAIDGVTLTSSTTKADLDLGTVVRILGTVTSVSDLSNIQDPNIGDAYKVSSESAYYVYNNQWEVLGGGGSSSGVLSRTVTLRANSWVQGVQTVTVSGVTASNTIITGAAPVSSEEYSDAVINCTAQNTDELTFTCVYEPSVDITVNVFIM